MKEQYIFLGAPGSGKGTQALRLVSEREMKHVSTGDLLRAEVKKGTPLGQKVDDIMKSGALVDDDTMLELLRTNCEIEKASYIFDGFPRNIDQAKALEERVLKGCAARAMFFSIPTDILVGRLTNRRTCQDCNTIYNLLTLPPQKEGVCDKCGGSNLTQRKDDREEVVRNRLDVYQSTIGPVLEYYREKGVLVEIDASVEVDKVFEQVLKEAGL